MELFLCFQVFFFKEKCRLHQIQEEQIKSGRSKHLQIMARLKIFYLIISTFWGWWIYYNISCRIFFWNLNTFLNLSQIFSMCGLMMKLKWCGKLKFYIYNDFFFFTNVNTCIDFVLAWLALYCSCISFANSRASDDAKQVIWSCLITYKYLI